MIVFGLKPKAYLLKVAQAISKLPKRFLAPPCYCPDSKIHFIISFIASQKARRPGRCVWHPEALISPPRGREEAPRLLRRKKLAIL
jgi:hypothetical protein